MFEKRKNVFPQKIEKNIVSNETKVSKHIEQCITRLINQLESMSNQFRGLFDEYGINKQFIIEKKDLGFFESMERGRLLESDGYQFARKLTELIRKDFIEIKRTALSLAELLEDNKKEFYQSQIKTLEIEKIQKKKYISVKEFAEIYGFSEDWQKNRRGRIRDKLPYIQTANGGKITYNVEEIELWFENNNVRK
jgi:hypothetical protein